ncbi:hypothetical protein HN511_00345 [bacterium]|nr:hypothetical protein [bacterium]
MRKLILIVSMSLIGIASIGFLIIQFYFEEKIKNFDQAAIGKIDKQKEIRFCMEKANEAITFSILLETIGSKNDQKTRENII